MVSGSCPGGGVEQNESIEEAAKREAAEELGLKVNIDRFIAKFDVTLISKDTTEHIKVPPFIVVHATPSGGQLRKEYAPNRKIVLAGKRELYIPQNLIVTSEYEWIRTYFLASKEAVRARLEPLWPISEQACLLE